MMNRQGSVLFEAPLAHEVGVHADYCNCRECRGNSARAFARGWAEREWEAVAKQNPQLPDINGFGPKIEGYSPYVGQSRCDPIAKPGVVAFRDLMLKAFPGTGNSGIVRECNQGKKSEHKEGRAWDWKVSAKKPSDVAKVNEALDWLFAVDKYGNQHAMIRRLGIMYIIWNRKIWSASKASKGWRDYNGRSPHTDHVHFSFSWDGANTKTTFWSGGPPTPPPSRQRPVLRLGSRGPVVRDLQARLNTWLAGRPRFGGRLLAVDGIFGPLTRAAVRAYQHSEGLSADGIVGSQTWMRLLRLSPAPGPQPPSPPSTAPALIGREDQPPDTTLYVDIRLGDEGRARPMTGIFIPEHYLPQPKVDILLYLHGFKAQRNQPDPGWSVNWYWNNLPLRAFREELNGSHKNIVLVTPTLGKNSEAGWLVAPGGLDRFLNAAIAALRTYGPYRGQPAMVGNIILACHSGGGLPMRALALSNQRYSPLIRECWGFDCMYNRGDASLWGDWARQNPNARLYNYYRLGTGTAQQSEILQQQNLPNVSVVPLRPQQISHDRVPITYWSTRIEEASFLLAR